MVDHSQKYFEPTAGHPVLTNSYDKDGNEGTPDGGLMWHNLFQFNDEGQRIQRYEHGFYIQTDPTTDQKAIEAATAAAGGTYCLMETDCSDVVTAAFSVARTRDGNTVQNGEEATDGFLNTVSSFIDSFIAEAPNRKQKLIEERNKLHGVNVDKSLVPTVQ